MVPYDIVFVLITFVFGFVVITLVLVLRYSIENRSNQIVVLFVRGVVAVFFGNLFGFRSIIHSTESHSIYIVLQP